ncbi:MAG: flagellar protein export ATPase FliI [Clostridia bacterium]|nr:flagellar protein export ATPase FliI [Anaerotignum sp.]NCC15156.1 flagellar protein export ATPase FliI [Clostridia bacterium]
MFNELVDVIKRSNTISHIGKIENIVGMAIEASGRKASIGEISMIYNENEKKQIMAETVGFRDDRILLMPYESMKGVSAGTFVKNTNECLKIAVGDFLQGRIIDAMGRPMDGLGELKTDQYFPVDSVATNPLTRPPIEEKMQFGVKAIDGLLTIGKGQRMGIFAGSGVGKSTLLGMLAKNVKTDINVIALVGERGREVREFIERDLGEEGLKRSVLVVATSDQSAMLRMKCPLVATAIAEYFKNQGKDVLLMMDSLTRFAMAQREIGLAIGEPPIARGYTPSIYAELPKLLERTGNFQEGSITGIYTVLVEGDDTNDPIADTVRGIIDGHIVLSRKLANGNHFPAIDVNASISRLMSAIAEKHHLELASKLRDILSIYEKNNDLISIGAYKHGTNHKLDFAISKIDKINSFLKQGVNEKFSIEETIKQMDEILKN